MVQRERLPLNSISLLTVVSLAIASFLLAVGFMSGFQWCGNLYVAQFIILNWSHMVVLVLPLKVCDLQARILVKVIHMASPLSSHWTKVGQICWTPCSEMRQLSGLFS